VPYDLKTLSFDAGDLKTPDFPGPEPAPPGAGAVVDGFALYAIVDYVEDRGPHFPPTSASALSSGASAAGPTNARPTRG